MDKLDKAVSFIRQLFYEHLEAVGKKTDTLDQNLSWARKSLAEDINLLRDEINALKEEISFLKEIIKNK